VGRVPLKVYYVALGLVAVLVVMNVSANMSPLDALIALLIIVGPWVGGGVLGWLWGKTWRGLAAAVALGPVLTGATLAAFLFLAGSSE
jgi:hypothetical protein